MNAAPGPRHAAARLLVLGLWAAAAFTAPVGGLALLTAVVVIGTLALPAPGRRRWWAGVARFAPWAAAWAVSAWWAADFAAAGILGAVRLGAATWVSVAAADLLLPGLLPGEVYRTVAEALSVFGRRVAEDTALVAAMMVRFVPLLKAEWQEQRWALAIERPGRGPLAEARRAAGALVPVLARAVQRADDLALVLWLKRPADPPAPGVGWTIRDGVWLMGMGMLWIAVGRMPRWPFS